jgi:hypothetical protein
MSLKAPRAAVKSVRDLIYWEYACLIAEAAGFAGNYGFVMSRYKKLKCGEMSWSGTIRDFLKQSEKGRSCIYCGGTENLTADHIVPSSRAGIDPRIHALLESQDNCVLACRTCNCQKRDRDAFQWYRDEDKGEVPKLVRSKFLKLVYRVHETQGTLDATDMNWDGTLDTYDLGVVLTDLLLRKPRAD